jgi:hypothetical protein
LNLAATNYDTSGSFQKRSFLERQQNSPFSTVTNPAQNQSCRLSFHLLEWP